MTRLLLVRHGESTWNAEGRWQGWADPPLTDLGRRQARMGAGAIDGVKVVVSSDLRRAVETATLMAEHLGAGTVQVEARLRERDVGEFTGLTRGEIEERWPGRLGAGAMTEPPGGESNAEVVERALVGVRRVVAEHAGRDILAVTHGGVIRNLERHLGVDPLRLPNLGGVWIDADDDGGLVAGPRILLIDPDDVAVTVPGQL